MALNNEIDLTVEQIPQNPIILTPTDNENYNDLANKPKINGFVLEDNKNSSQLGLASLSQGAKADSALQPGNNITALVNDAGYITKSVNNLDNYTKTSALSAVATSGAYSDLTGTPTLATVATSGDYDDLSDKPSIMVGADGVNAGASGFVPAPSATDNDKFLKGNGTWSDVGAGKSIGEVFYSQSSSAQDNPGALPLFTGETISNADQVYPQFYAWVADHAGLQISAADYETALTTYGECPKYVIDTTNKTIRLPKLVNYLKMANTTDGIAQAGAGLPNITGDVPGRGWNNVNSVSNAFYTTQNGIEGRLVGENGTGKAITFNASNSNSIYGNSNTVTPTHTTLFPWVCAYNAAVPASTAQAAQFQAALSSKADIDLNNATTSDAFLEKLGPDWDSAIDYSNDTTAHTIPSAGYLVMNVARNTVSTTGSLRLSINGSVVASSQHTSAYVTVLNGMYRVNKNDTVQINETSSNDAMTVFVYKFVPLKGVN